MDWNFPMTYVISQFRHPAYDLRLYLSILSGMNIKETWQVSANGVAGFSKDKMQKST